MLLCMRFHLHKYAVCWHKKKLPESAYILWCKALFRRIICTLIREKKNRKRFNKIEKIDVYNVTNGERFSTYVIQEPAGSGNFFVNGAAAHRAKKGDKIIVASYAHIEEKDINKHKPNVIRLDENNKIVG